MRFGRYPGRELAAIMPEKGINLGSVLMKATTILKKISGEIEHLFSLSKEPVSIIKKAGEVIIKARQPGKFMYVVKKGAVDIEHNDTRLERVTKGGIVGEMSLVDEAPRSATVVAHKDSVLLPIGRARFMHLVQKNPEFALLVMNTMVRRIRQMNLRMEKVGNKSR